MESAPTDSGGHWEHSTLKSNPEPSNPKLFEFARSFLSRNPISETTFVSVEKYFNFLGLYAAGTNFKRDTLQNFLVSELIIFTFKMQVALHGLKRPLKWPMRKKVDEHCSK